LETETNQPVSAGEVAAASQGTLSGDAKAAITDVTHDSRQAKAGSLFAAVRGELFDAHKFIPQVMQQGAVGVISELARPSDFQGVWIQVEDIRRAMAVAAAAVHRHPSHELKLAGITGTNGKTTCAYLIASIPEAAGEPVGMTGTVEYRLGGERKKAGRTTPEAPDMQRLFRRAVALGCKTAVMECSSQAMDFHRCDELEYEVAVFTNLTRDHLDYHKTMENYWYAKQRLFDGRLGSRPRTSAINVDDAHGVELADRLDKEGLRVVRYAVNSEADIAARDADGAKSASAARMFGIGGGLAVAAGITLFVLDRREHRVTERPLRAKKTPTPAITPAPRGARISLSWDF